VDKVAVLGLQGAREGRSLRERTKTEAVFTTVHAANQYLGRGEIWGRLKHDQTRIQKMDHVKGLVPIEIKVA
jgi:hypothetical protein